MHEAFPVASLVGALILALVYVLRGGAGESGFSGRFWARRLWVSVAAGVSVAYVFVDVLPELAEQNHRLREGVGEHGLAFADHRIYLLSLLAFVVIYGLDHIVLAARQGAHEHTATPHVAERDAVWWLHVGGFSLYSALIGYLLVERAEQGHAALAVYVLAMAVHFIIVNHSLAEEHGQSYRSVGHWLPALGVLLGWAGGLLAPLSPEIFARVFALLAGGIVITSLKTELPDGDRGRFLPFLAGAAGFTALLLLAAA
jgi:hypothetical protein